MVEGKDVQSQGGLIYWKFGESLAWMFHRILVSIWGAGKAKAGKGGWGLIIKTFSARLGNTDQVLTLAHIWLLLSFFQLNLCTASIWVNHVSSYGCAFISPIISLKDNAVYFPGKQG